jgi:hypothetical protein
MALPIREKKRFNLWILVLPVALGPFHESHEAS